MKRKMGRPTIGERAMTEAERQRRHRGKTVFRDETVFRDKIVSDDVEVKRTGRFKRPGKRPRGVGVLVHALTQAGLVETTEALEALAEGGWLKDVRLAEPEDRSEAYDLLLDLDEVRRWLLSVILDTVTRENKDADGEADEADDDS